MVLAAIGQIGARASRLCVEYTVMHCGALSMEGRMTICKHVDRGRGPDRDGRAGRDAFSYLEGRPAAPTRRWERALDEWRGLRTDDGASTTNFVVDVSALKAAVTWGRTRDGPPVDGVVPDPGEFEDRQREPWSALRYMIFAPCTPTCRRRIDKVFIARSRTRGSGPPDGRSGRVRRHVARACRRSSSPARRA